MSNIASGPPTRVLVADDEENRRHRPRRHIVQPWGYAVETAADGQEALDKVDMLPCTS